VEERLVRFRATTVLAILGIAIAVGILLEVIWIARHIITWILVAVFLTLALNPAVELLQSANLRPANILGLAATYCLLCPLH